MMAGSLPMPSFTFIESRIHLLNKRLEEASAERSDRWWQKLVDEFFKQSALLAMTIPIDGPKSFAIQRFSIPKFFKSFYTDGATELYFIVRQTKEIYDRQINSMTVTSRRATMVTRYRDQASTSAFVEGNLTIEFSYDCSMKIKNWDFEITSHKELIPKQIMTDPVHAETITICGIAREAVSLLKRHGEIVIQGTFSLRYLDESTSSSRREQGSKRTESRKVLRSTKRKRRSRMRKAEKTVTSIGEPSCRNSRAVEAEHRESSSTSSRTSRHTSGVSPWRQGRKLGNTESLLPSTSHTESPASYHSCAMSPRPRGQMSTPQTPFSRISPRSGWSVQSTVQPISKFPDQAVNDSE